MKSPGDEHASTVKPYGFVPGTFSLELIHHSNPERGADVIVTLPWSSAPNAYGVPGRAAYAGGGATGPVTGVASEHGSFSPWDVHNTLLAWGPDIKRGAVSDVPAGNADITPTVLALAGIPAERRAARRTRADRGAGLGARSPASPSGRGSSAPASPRSRSPRSTASGTSTRRGRTIPRPSPPVLWWRTARARSAAASRPRSP